MSNRKRKPRKGPSLLATYKLTEGHLINDSYSNATGEYLGHQEYPREYWMQTEITHSPRVAGDMHSPKPWAYRIWRHKLLTGTGQTNYGTFTTRFSGATFSPGDPVSIPLPQWDRDDLYNDALERLNEKVRGSLDLSISLAEAGRTAKMVRATSKVEEYLKTLKSFGSVSRLSRQAANRWLEWTYGWKPLVNDLYQAADESQRFVLNKIERITASKSEKIPDLDRVYTTFAGNSLPLHIVYNGKTGYRITISLEHPTYDIARWTSLNPVSIAWELLPYSFVVDWVYDVGQFLRATETGFLYGLLFKEGFVSHLQAFMAEGKGSITSSYGFEEGSCSHEFKRFERLVLPSYPFPRKPSLKVSLGSSRLLSAAALLRQQLKR